MPVDRYRCYTVFLGQDPNYEDFRLVRVMGMKWNLCAEPLVRGLNRFQSCLYNVLTRTTFTIIKGQVTYTHMSI